MGDGKRALSGRSQKILEVLAERMIPSGGPDYPGSRDFNLPEKVISMFGAFSGGRLALRGVLWMWELMPLFFFKFHTFTGLSDQAQVEFLEGWEKSGIFIRRAALTGLRAMFMAAFYGDPEVHKRIGYAPGCLQPLEKIVPPWSPEDAGR